MASKYKTTVEIAKDLKAIQGKSEQALHRIVSDAKRRAPGWISSEVTQVYGIKKSEVKPSKIKGDTVDSLEIIYTGRPLTPIHFRMKPSFPAQGRAYTLRYEVLRGNKTTSKVKKLSKKQRAAIGKNFRRQGTRASDHSPIMLMHTGASSADKVQYIPFQRKSSNRKDIEAIKTLSVPQMVSGERTQPAINQAIESGLAKLVEQRTRAMLK